MVVTNVSPATILGASRLTNLSFSPMHDFITAKGAPDERRIASPTHDAKKARKTAGASFIGTMAEYYDFFIYGTASALVFNKIFFPDIDPVLGTLAAFSTYAVGFFARPLGGLVWGHIGDKIGRKKR